MGLWVALLCVDKVGELCWLAEEKDGGVVEYPVKVSLGGADLDGEAAWVSGGVGGAGLASDGGESDGDRRLCAWLEELCAAQVAGVVGGLKVSVCSAALCVDDALWDTLAVKGGEELDEGRVLEEELSADAWLASELRRGVWVVDGCAVWQRVLGGEKRAEERKKKGEHINSDCGTVGGRARGLTCTGSGWPKVLKRSEDGMVVGGGRVGGERERGEVSPSPLPFAIIVAPAAPCAA